jgi:hypothetical protein
MGKERVVFLADSQPPQRLGFDFALSPPRPIAPSPFRPVAFCISATTGLRARGISLHAGEL